MISGFVIPHPGYIQKIICEGVAYINLNTAADDIINSLDEEQINKLKLHYKKEDFKNDFFYDLKGDVDFNIYSNNPPIENKKSFFEIIIFKKSFKRPLPVRRFTPFIEHLLPKPELTYRAIIKKFEWVQIVISEDKTLEIHEVRLVMQISNNESIRLENGDTLNIRIPHFPDDLFLEKNILNDVLKLAVMHLFTKLNFNFTFLIELDPL